MENSSFIELAEKHWHKVSGLIFAGIAALAEIPIMNMMGADKLFMAAAYIITLAIISIFWFVNNKTPQTQKGKVGFVICIYCSDKGELLRIKEDFISTLRSLLKQGNTGKITQVIEIPQHIAENINDIDNARLLMLRTKAHFVIFGRVRLRNIDGKDCHLIDMEGLVRHEPISIDTKKTFVKEFGELFPRKVLLSTENDTFSFEFTSALIDSVARYIIGIAAMLSRDLNYAEKLFHEVKAKINAGSSDFPIFEKLKERIPIRLSEIKLTWAMIHLNTWTKTRDQKNLDKFAENLKSVPENIFNEYRALILRGIEAFLNGRNIEKAIEYTKKCTKDDDPVPFFNLAFLYAYDGNLQKALQQYRKGMYCKVDPDTITQIEDFLLWILEEEPDKYQYYYCLGYFNWKIKGDHQQAVKDFAEFLKRSQDGKFEKEKELATQWIEEINKSKTSLTA